MLPPIHSPVNSASPRLGVVPEPRRPQPPDLSVPDRHERVHAGVVRAAAGVRYVQAPARGAEPVVGERDRGQGKLARLLLKFKWGNKDWLLGYYGESIF